MTAATPCLCTHLQSDHLQGALACRRPWCECRAYAVAPRTVKTRAEWSSLIQRAAVARETAAVLVTWTQARRDRSVA